MKIIAIVQARMRSTRLEGKILRPLAGKPMIHRVLERLARVPQLHGITVATSTSEAEEPLIDSLRGFPDVRVFRGSEDDVLSRYYGAAIDSAADLVVRITSDCPLISPEVSGRVIREYLECSGHCDYASNVRVRTYPRGLDTEVFSLAALERAHREATDRPEREHVTPYILRRPHIFRLHDVTGTEDLHHLRWTVDTAEDFELVSRIYDSIHCGHPDFDYRDVLELLELHPEWNEINRLVKQKGYGE